MGYREECEKLFLENIELKKELAEAKKLIDDLWESEAEKTIVLDKIQNYLKKVEKNAG